MMGKTMRGYVPSIRSLGSPRESPDSLELAARRPAVVTVSTLARDMISSTVILR